MLTKELVAISMPWNVIWYEAIEKLSNMDRQLNQKSTIRDFKEWIFIFWLYQNSFEIYFYCKSFCRKNPLKACTDVMRPLHDMINRENAETMDQKEFKATHDKDIKDKEENLINLERRIEDYIMNEANRNASDNNQIVGQLRKLVKDWICSYKWIGAQLDQKIRATTRLNLKKVSPRLLESKSLDVVIPG